MKVIIAGSRNITDNEDLEEAIRTSGFGLEISEVVSGAARGVDRLGEDWAFKNGVPVRQFRADWDKYRGAAGRLRNIEMARYADALIAVWDGESRGTKHMIDVARLYGLRIHVHHAEPTHYEGWTEAPRGL